MSQLRTSESQEAFADEGDEEADFEDIAYRRSRWPRKQTARKALASRKYDLDDNEIDSNDDDIDTNDGPKNPMEAKQNSLHLRSTEVLIKTRFHGEFTCFRSQIDNLYPSLPHSTIKSVLKSFGVSAKRLQVLQSFRQGAFKIRR